MRTVTYLFGVLTTLPLVMVGLTVLAVSHFNWHSILLFLAALVASWANQMWVLNSDLNFSLDELIGFRNQFPGVTFTSIPVSEYVSVLREQVPHLRSRKPEEILPFSTRLQDNRLRILVCSNSRASDPQARPTARLTYASFLGAWMIVADPPERTHRLGLFVLLHEVGHTAFVSFVSRVASKIAVRNMILPAVFLALLITPTLKQGVGLLVLALGWLALATAQQRFFRAKNQLYDEIYADRFALERSNPEWFQKSPVSEFVSRIAKMENPEGTSEEDLRQRTVAFSENLERLKQGQSLRTPRELLPGYRWNFLEEILLASLLVLAGVAHAPLSGRRLLVLWLFTFVLFLFGTVISFVQVLQRDAADHIFGVKEAPPRELELIRRMGSIRRRKSPQSSISPNPSA